MSVAFEIAGAEPTVRPARPRGTVAISSALLITSCFIGFAFLEPDAPPPATVTRDLRASLIPQEFSCSGHDCRKEDAGSGLPHR
jgi:hypothetical protein